MALVRQRIFDLAGAALFLGIGFGEFARLVREGNDAPEGTNCDDLVYVRFHREALERWRLGHSFGDART
jgi:hypothetical protein